MIELYEIDLSKLPEIRFEYWDDSQAIPDSLREKLWEWLCNPEGKKLAKSKSFRFERGLLVLKIPTPTPLKTLNLEINVCRDKSKGIEFLGPVQMVKEEISGNETTLKDYTEELRKAFQTGATAQVSRYGTHSGRKRTTPLSGGSVHLTGIPEGWMGNDPTQGAGVPSQFASMRLPKGEEAQDAQSQSSVDEDIDDEFLDVPRTEPKEEEDHGGGSGTFRTTTETIEPISPSLFGALGTSFLLGISFRMLIQATINGWKVMTVEHKDGGDEMIGDLLDHIGHTIPAPAREGLESFRKDSSRPFHTMVFDPAGGLRGKFCRRYAREGQALDGHNAVCEEVAKQ